MPSRMFRRKEGQSRSIGRGVPVNELEIKRRRDLNDYSIPQRDFSTQQRKNNKPSMREMRPPIRQSRSLRSLDSEEWSDTDGEGSVKSLITPEERARVHRRLKSLEKRSRKTTSVEAYSMDLTSLIANEEWKHVMRKIGSDPQSMQVKHTMELNGKRTKAYPLHQAVSHRPPTTVVDALIAVYPDALKIPDEVFGMLPLHIACKYRASSQVLKLLMECFPDAVRLTDSVDRRLPLHYACNVGYPNDVSMLMNAERRALMAKDVDGKTPIDVAQESKSPHRDAILKRIYEVSKYGGGISGNNRSKRKGRTARAAPVTPNYAADQIPKPIPAESPSEVTVETSNLTRRTMGKAKSMLPTWARGGKKSGSGSDGSRNAVPEHIDAFPESPLDGVPQGRDIKRASSFERLRINQKMADKFLDQDSRSLPDDIDGNGYGNNRPLDPREEVSSLPSNGRRKKKSRKHANAVPEVGLSYGQVASVKRESVRGSTRSVPWDEAMDRQDSSSSSLDAPEVVRRKKKGLSSNSDIRKLLEQEGKEASRQEAGYDTKLLSLPFGNSPDKQSAFIDPSSSRERLNGHRNLPPVQQNAARMSTRLTETEQGHHSLPSTSRNTLVSSPNEAEVANTSMPMMVSPSLLSPNSNDPRSFQHANDLVKPSPVRPHLMLSPRGRPTTIPENGIVLDHEDEVKQHHLQLRKAALVEECNHVNESIAKGRAKAQMIQSKVSLLEGQIQQLQVSLEREMTALDATLSGIGLHEELLQEHKGKIEQVDRELQSIQQGNRESPSRESDAHSSEKGSSVSGTTSGALGNTSSSPSSSDSSSDDSTTSSSSSSSSSSESSSSDTSSSGSSSSSSGSGSSDSSGSSSANTGTSSSRASSVEATL